jgi:hypothetical protein
MEGREQIFRLVTPIDQVGFSELIPVIPLKNLFPGAVDDQVRQAGPFGSVEYLGMASRPDDARGRHGENGFARPVPVGDAVILVDDEGRDGAAINDL